MIFTQVGFLERFLDFESSNSKGADHLERKEPNDINSVVVRFEIKSRWKIKELAKAFSCL